MNNSVSESEVKLLAEDLEREIRAARPRWSLPVTLLRSASHDENLLMKILEFVDVLPLLNTTDEIYEHFNQLIQPHVASLPRILRLGANLASSPFMRTVGMGITRWIINNQVAPYFIVVDEKALVRTIRRTDKSGVVTCVDFLGEEVTSNLEAAYMLEQYKNAMRRFGNKDTPFHIAIKFSSLYTFFSSDNYEESKRVVSRAFAELLCLANETNSFVEVDAEQYLERWLILDIFCDVLTSDDFCQIENACVALQAYLLDTMELAEYLMRVLEKRRVPVFSRLVKGAYLETEIAYAQQKNWQSPVQKGKDKTDENFDRIFQFLAENWGTIYVSPATHNPFQIAYAYLLADKFGFLNDKNFIFQILYGIGKPIVPALLKRNLNVLVYTPVGAAQMMSYLVRRFRECTSQMGFLNTLLQ